MYLYKLIEYTISRVNLDRVWVIMMCQHRVVNCTNKCNTLVGEVDNGKGCACVRVEGLRGNLELTLSFTMSLKPNDDDDNSKNNNGTEVPSLDPGIYRLSFTRYRRKRKEFGGRNQYSELDILSFMALTGCGHSHRCLVHSCL